MQLQSGTLLQIADHVEEIPGLRIAARSEHADQAFRLRARGLAELLKSDRRLDVVAQDRLAVSTSPVSIVSIPSRSSASA
jgi:hypothetical protein